MMRITIPKQTWHKLATQSSLLKAHKIYTKGEIYTVDSNGGMVHLKCEPEYTFPQGLQVYESIEKLRREYKPYMLFNCAKTQQPMSIRFKFKPARDKSAVTTFLCEYNHIIAVLQKLIIFTFDDGIASVTALHSTSPIIKSLVAEYNSITKIKIERVSIEDAPETEYIDLYEDTILTRHRHSSYVKMLTEQSDVALVNIGNTEAEAELRTKLKNHVNETLAAKTNLPIDCIDAVVKGWADSSFSVSSQKMQNAAASIFGLTKNEYSKTQIDSDATPDARHYKIAEAIYRKTQECLKEHGIQKVFLHRGLTLPTSVSNVVSESQSVFCNPLSSFANSYEVAYNFANDSCIIDIGASCWFPYILGGWFPAEMIFSTPFTGMGCHREMEFIVLGGNHTLSNDPLFYASLTKSMLDNFSAYKFVDFLGSYEPNRILTMRDSNKVTNDIETFAIRLKTSQDIVINIAKGREVDYVYDCVSSAQLNIDDTSSNSDWCKQSWDLPAYKSKAFYQYLKQGNQTLKQFQLQPVYKMALKRNLICED
jgi:hypothetical protein